MELKISQALEDSGSDKTETIIAYVTISEEILLDVDILIYTIGSIVMAGVSIGFVLWGFKTGQFKDNEHLKRAPLDEEEENVS